MADGFYEFGMRAFSRGEIAWLNSGGSNIRAGLIDVTDYTVDLVTHDFVDDISGGGGLEEQSGNMTLVDGAADGVCDASDITFSGTAGDACDADSVPIAYFDSASGLPVTLGGDVTIAWDAAGVFTI